MIDFVDPVVWPAFNVADACIVIGVLVLLYVVDRTRAANRARGESARAMSQRRLEVGDDDAGVRLDAFLAAARRRVLAHRGAAPDRRRRGRGRRAAAGRRTTACSGGEQVTWPSRRSTPSAPEPVEFEVVYEDEHLLVVDKPAGLVVHPAPGHAGTTLAEALAVARPAGPIPSAPASCTGSTATPPACSSWRSPRPSHAALQQQLRERDARARVPGARQRPSRTPSSGTIDAPLGRDRVRRALQSTHTDRPREAITHFTVIERLARTALLRVKLDTGRTHQIRAHMAAIGHPVCGDGPYGGGASGRRLRLKRQFLHASKLMFSHPVTGAEIVCESKPPVELHRALDVARREPVSGGPDGD